MLSASEKIGLVEQVFAFSISVLPSILAVGVCAFGSCAGVFLIG